MLIYNTYEIYVSEWLTFEEKKKSRILNGFRPRKNKEPDTQNFVLLLPHPPLRPYTLPPH